MGWVTIMVRSAAGREFSQPANVDKLRVYKKDDTVVLEFEEGSVVSGSVTLPVDAAAALAKVLLNVVEGYTPDITAKLP